MPKQKTVKIGSWIFEAKPNNQFFARKSENFGDEYKATLVITIRDDKAIMELYCNKLGDKHKRSDYQDFNDFLKSRGCSVAVFERFKNGKKQLVTKRVV